MQGEYSLLRSPLRSAASRFSLFSSSGDERVLQFCLFLRWPVPWQVVIGSRVPRNEIRLPVVVHASRRHPLWTRYPL
jgi:hypothetical protein